jgi:Ricin-type beta-trefoil lectin domain-like
LTTGLFNDGRDEWCLTETEEDIYLLVNAKSSKVVDVEAFSMGNESNIQPCQNHGCNNKKWMLSTDTISEVTPVGWECAGFSHFPCNIVSAHSGMSLSVDGEASGTNVHQVHATSPIIDWIFVPTAHGFYHMIVQHSGLAMAVTGDED